MKKALTNKVMLCSLIIMLILILLQGFSFAKSENIQMIKKSENEYMIYVSNLLDEEFKFAFSNESSADKEKLVFKDSAIDQIDNGKNIAYIDSEIYEQYFKDKENVFLWVKQGEEYKLEAEEVNLTSALSEEEIQAFNQATKKITVEVGEKELPTETVDGVKVNRKIGTINIKDDQTAAYSYKMVKATKGTNAAKLIELANKMNELEDKNIFEKLSVYSEFKTIYAKLEPAVNDTKWTEVKEYIIEQPQDSKKGEQYLVWVKKDLKDTTITDVQIMTCKDEYTQQYENKEVIIKETTKLPITGDTIVLFVIAGIILISIITVAVLKFKNKNKK